MTKYRKFKLVCLIPDVLYSVKYEGESKNEFQKLFNNWGDPLWLYKFFSQNLDDLNRIDDQNRKIWGGISVANAVRNTRIQAKDMMKTILAIANGQNDDFKILSDYFKPLVDGD
ncbi:hypothetical protein [Flavobacterium fluviatile]|uniref:hypothetical protein n=1 Tax=Flavobacterium fluviatile TaxID=1862387 RepID=UPI0013D415A1|nr:hypothetical protein [Flavobacterium fluviatile]